MEPGGGSKYFFVFTPIPQKKSSNLTSIYVQMGWFNQLQVVADVSPRISENI